MDVCEGALCRLKVMGVVMGFSGIGFRLDGL
jgi:hypothetical protein